MTRFLFQLLLAVLPFVLYAVFIRLSGKGTLKSFEDWRHAPLLWLLLGGIVLSVGFLFVLRLSADNSTTGRYVPPHMENGKIVPAEIKPNKDEG